MNPTLQFYYEHLGKHILPESMLATEMERYCPYMGEQCKGFIDDAGSFRSLQVASISAGTPILGRVGRKQHSLSIGPAMTLYVSKKQSRIYFSAGHFVENMGEKQQKPIENPFLMPTTFPPQVQRIVRINTKKILKTTGVAVDRVMEHAQASGVVILTENDPRPIDHVIEAILQDDAPYLLITPAKSYNKLIPNLLMEHGGGRWFTLSAQNEATRVPMAQRNALLSWRDSMKPKEIKMLKGIVQQMLHGDMEKAKEHVDTKDLAEKLENNLPNHFSHAHNLLTML
jgi:hypothetical protein